MLPDNRYAVFKHTEPDFLSVKFSGLLPSVEAFASYLQEFTQRLENTEKPLFTVLDSTHACYITDEMCYLQANWIKQNKKLLLAKVVFTIFIIPDSIQKLLFFKINNLQQMPVPFKIFSGHAEANTYLQANKVKVENDWKVKPGALIESLGL